MYKKYWNVLDLAYFVHISVNQQKIMYQLFLKTSRKTFHGNADYENTYNCRRELNNDKTI